MVKEGNMLAHLRYLLKDNFPNDSNEEIEKKLRTLSNYDDSWYDENIILYIPKFRWITLRVGICCEGTNKAMFFITDAEKELRELLKL